MTKDDGIDIDDENFGPHRLRSDYKARVMEFAAAAREPIMPLPGMTQQLNPPLERPVESEKLSP